MKIRVGKLVDQDRWRRDDLRACTPGERVNMLLQMQSAFLEDSAKPVERVLTVRDLRLPLTSDS
jgi:hypothetical protein